MADRKIEIKKMASRVNLILPYVESEALTKDALVMPFLQLLGFDAEQIRSDTAMLIRIAKRDVRANFAIFKGGRLSMLIECVHHHCSLEEHQTFLNKYGKTTRPKYGMLTNGIEYRFYSAAMMSVNDFSKPLFSFFITRTYAGRINRMLNEHNDLLALN